MIYELGLICFNTLQITPCDDKPQTIPCTFTSPLDGNYIVNFKCELLICVI